MGSLENHLHSFPARTISRMKHGMNIQDAIRSGKPFRRKGWPDDGIFVVYVEHDIVLTLEDDFSTSVLLDIQDILADDWYTREEDDLPWMHKYLRTSNYSSYKEVR